MTHANTELKELEPLTKENTNLKRRLEEVATKSERAEKSKSELEKNLTQANADLKDLKPLDKESIDLKKKPEWATDILKLSGKSKFELKKSMNQTNDGLRVQLRKAKVMLNEAEDTKASELDLLIEDNADLRNQLQEIKIDGKEQESDDVKKRKTVDLLVKEYKDLENEPQKVRAILQEVRSEPEANLTETNTRLKTDLQKQGLCKKRKENPRLGSSKIWPRRTPTLRINSDESRLNANSRNSKMQRERKRRLKP